MNAGTLPAGRADPRNLEVVPRWEGRGIVAWDVWANRQPRPHGWVGDWIETFDHEGDAIDFIDRRARASA